MILYLGAGGMGGGGLILWIACVTYVWRPGTGSIPQGVCQTAYLCHQSRLHRFNHQPLAKAIMQVCPKIIIILCIHDIDDNSFILKFITNECKNCSYNFVFVGT